MHDEQRYLLDAGGRHLHERVRFVQPTAPPGQRKGDCIRLLGNTVATQVRYVRVSGVTFATCARSGIGVQRNVNSLKVMVTTSCQTAGTKPSTAKLLAADSTPAWN